jgi:16S rRNA (guanine527-N7)-methyltransferase
MLPEFRERLNGALAGRVVLSAAQVGALEAHCELMLKWNRTINLTTITRVADVVERHYAESLVLGACLPDGEITVVDVGSGAGFPGVPVAVLRPGARVTLVESHQRKAVFLREATRGMGNVLVRAVRADAVEAPFDWLVSRAVSAEDLAAVMRLGRSALLLTGADEPPQVGGWEWRSVPLPWGKQRWIRVGTREGSN